MIVIATHLDIQVSIHLENGNFVYLRGCPSQSIPTGNAILPRKKHNTDIQAPEPQTETKIDYLICH